MPSKLLFILFFLCLVGCKDTTAHDHLDSINDCGIIYTTNDDIFTNLDVLEFSVHFIQYFPDGSNQKVNKVLARRGIKSLNDYYKNAKIQFTLAGAETILDSEAYNGMNNYTKYLYKYSEKNRITIHIFPDNEEPRFSGAAIGIPGTSFAIKKSYLRASTIGHEMGHLLGLFHTFSVDESQDMYSYETGDYVCDTPNANKYKQYLIDECIYTGPGGYNDYDKKTLVCNLMSYGDPFCRKCLTQGQIDRMRFIIQNSQDLRSAMILPTTM